MHVTRVQLRRVSRLVSNTRTTTEVSETQLAPAATAVLYATGKHVPYRDSQRKLQKQKINSDLERLLSDRDLSPPPTHVDPPTKIDKFNIIQNNLPRTSYKPKNDHIPCHLIYKNVVRENQITNTVMSQNQIAMRDNQTATASSISTIKAHQNQSGVALEVSSDGNKTVNMEQRSNQLSAKWEAKRPKFVQITRNENTNESRRKAHQLAQEVISLANQMQPIVANLPVVEPGNSRMRIEKQIIK